MAACVFVVENRFAGPTGLHQQKKAQSYQNFPPFCFAERFDRSLLRSLVQIKDRGSSISPAAIRAAKHRVGHVAKAHGTPALNLNLLFEAKPFIDHCALQFYSFGLVSPQNVGHGTSIAQMRPPARRLWILLNQAANLHITAAIKVGVIKFAFFTSRSSHHHTLKLNAYLPLMQVPGEDARSHIKTLYPCTFTPSR